MILAELAQSERENVCELARGLQRDISEEIRRFIEAPREPRNEVAKRKYPAFTQWYLERLRDGWDLVTINGELADYGVVTWKGRQLDAALVTERLKLSNRLLGEYKEECFTVGYLDDKEFSIHRNPISTPCEDNRSIERYKAANDFSSRWRVD